MSAIEEALRANAGYASRFNLGHLPLPPARKLAVLACMDARLTVESVLGLSTGDAHIIRNAGGIASEDAVRSLVISHHLLGTREFVIINHTDCGMLTFKDDELRTRLEREAGGPTVAPSRFYAFDDLETNVRRQIDVVRSHPWLPRGIPVRGFIYDVRSGRLNEVAPGPERLTEAAESTVWRNAPATAGAGQPARP
ncbi:MAG: beta-class carbonic anhydrase [Candidatus Eiseniibacteriota bacterium]